MIIVCHLFICQSLVDCSFFATSFKDWSCSYVPEHGPVPSTKPLFATIWRKSETIKKIHCFLYLKNWMFYVEAPSNSFNVKWFRHLWIIDRWLLCSPGSFRVAHVHWVEAKLLCVAPDMWFSIVFIRQVNTINNNNNNKPLVSVVFHLSTPGMWAIKISISFGPKKLSGAPNSTSPCPFKIVQ